MKPGLRHVLTPLMIAGGLSGAAILSPTGFANSAEQVRLSPEAARTAARKALLSGDPKTAALLSGALLKRDPDDITALVVMAGALQVQNQSKQAIIHAKRAYNLSDSDRARFDAAMIISRALYQQKRFAASQFWLRRSGHVAPSAQLRAVAMRDFRSVQQVNPVETKVQVGVAPSSNINNGSESEIVFLNGLPFVLSGDAQALSGIEATLGLKTTRRFSLGEGRVGSIGLNLLSRSYRLSAASLAVSGGKTGADYAFAAAEIELGLVSAVTSGKTQDGRKSATMTLGRNWYAGAPLTDYLRGQIGRDFKLAKGNPLHIGLSVERQIRLDSAIRSATLVGLNGSTGIRLSNGNYASFSYDVRNVFSASSEIAHIAHSASVSYALSKPVIGTQVSLSLGLSGKNYKMPYLSPVPRRDLGVNATLSILLPKYEVMGFAPNIDVNFSRNFSSVDLYDTTRQSISVGVKSTF